MPNKKTRKVRQSLTDAFAALGAAVASAYKLAPAVVVMASLVAAGVITLSLWSTTLMMGMVLLIVWGVSLLVYAKTANFGEAALALVAGLLTVFSVEWTPRRFVAFSVAWVGFALMALLVSSIRIASKVETIYQQAAYAAAQHPGEADEVERRLREIGEKSKLGQVGPVERAEILRLPGFRAKIGATRELAEEKPKFTYCPLNSIPYCTNTRPTDISSRRAAQNPSTQRRGGRSAACRRGVARFRWCSMPIRRSRTARSADYRSLGDSALDDNERRTHAWLFAAIVR